ncbi:hypothetical protein FQN54_006454 [Arachnomyces sp. PD_36]|nr:hypothetical protein FQN54_006454 [Arachnomyces sp. PD_36]
MDSGLTRSQARKIIDNIRHEQGAITQEERDNSLPGVLVALENLQRRLGSATRTLAQHLYSTETRYVFELIQNAEDNTYDHAISRGEDPYIHFHVYPDKVIIDSNEDGFAKEHVRAICSTGDSTKANAIGYIGEKGIGFKSVFKIARKVHIQSGPFSFFFEHSPEDSGIGMVAPTPTAHETLPDKVRTRMTLTLLDPSRFTERVNETKEVPDTFVLFLSKLRRISFSVCGSEEHRHEATYSCTYDSSDDSAKLVKVVYSFLPMRKVGLNFLVQSDFITQASREDIQQSAWNDSLLDGVAQTFRDAILQFCKQPALQYSWLKYLPGPNISDPFWDQLREKIFNALKFTPVFLSWNSVLAIPESLRIVLPVHLDKDYQPLFDDLPPEIYLSDKYQDFIDNEGLQLMGIKVISWGELLRRLGPYLQEENPRFSHPNQHDDWHTRVASLLRQGLESRTVAPRIRSLNLIPITSGALASVLSANIYFPTDEHDIQVPVDLPFPIVDEQSTRNVARKSLFNDLGVKTCRSEAIRDRIYGRYVTPMSVSLSESISHLRYLYLAFPEAEELDSRVHYLISQDLSSVYRRKATIGQQLIVDDLYFETEGRYGTKALKQTLRYRSSLFGTTLGYTVHLLHSSYLDAVPTDAQHRSRSWQKWLETVAGVRRVPRLRQSPQRDRLSYIFQAIVSNFSYLLLGLLKEYWSSYSEFDKSESVLRSLREAAIPCENVGSVPLQSTYFPSDILKRESCELSISDKIPFLILPPEYSDPKTQEWGFLDKLGVGIEVDLRFLLESLGYLVAKIRRPEWGDDVQTSLFKLYEELSDKASAGSEARQTIREKFAELKAVYVPESNPPLLVAPSECVWKGLSLLTVRRALGFYDHYSGNRKIHQLFRNVLRIKHATTATYIDELKKAQESGSPQGIPDIYKELDNLTTANELESLQDAFEQYRLVYVPSQSRWYAPSSCLWTRAHKVGNQFGIANDYANLEDFFVQKLDIQEPTIATYVEQLKQLSTSSSPDAAQVKSAIRSLNQLGPNSDDVRDLEDVEFLPLRLGNNSLIEFDSPSSSFWIVDRDEYGAAFNGKVHVLGFSLEETREFRQFLLALGLEDRHMSMAVRQNTNVIDPDHTPSRRLTSQFREKARILLRCAIHFHSIRAKNEGQAVYSLLQQAKIYESEGFSKILSLRQGEREVTAESAKGKVHRREENNQLEIFVPRNSRDRRLCYANQLPLELVRYFDIHDPHALGVFKTVIGNDLDILEDLLEEHGIGSVNTELYPDPAVDLEERRDAALSGEEDDEVTVVEFATASETASATGTPPVLVPSAQDTRVSPPELADGWVVATSTARESRSPAPQPDRLTSPSPHRPPPPPPAPDYGQANVEAYRVLLEDVVGIARGMGFPVLQLSRSGTLPSPPSVNGQPFGNRNQNRFEHDKLVGAAGELFVFELLLRLNLPGFSRRNWQSIIRHEAQVHTDYIGMEPWRGVESADIVYNDIDSTLTQLLLTAGLLRGEGWQTMTPEYFIEVKSTPGPCHTEFYMSQNQVDRMEEMKLQRPSTRVYLIFRVYHLGRHDMMAKIYLDPATLRDEGRLRFSSNMYTVLPGRGAN